MNNATRITLRRMLLMFCATSYCVAGCNLLPAHADLVLETETAELGHKGDMLVSSGVQFEKERDGSRTAFTLNQYEYAISDRAEILIEPLLHEWDHPTGSPSFEGMGDLEITPSYMVVKEKPKVPAVVLAFKLKVPMARNSDIGTGQYDYLPCIILRKTYDRWVLNAKTILKVSFMPRLRSKL